MVQVVIRLLTLLISTLVRDQQHIKLETKTSQRHPFSGRARNFQNRNLDNSADFFHQNKTTFEYLIRFIVFNFDTARIA
jgi:hypothetical protein